MDLRGKILSFDALIQKTARLKKAGKKVVQSHGVFDLIHPGVITHLEAAKSKGDVLVVTVIEDKDVRKGPGRPIFEDVVRAEAVAALQMVDYVAVVDDEVPFEAVRRLKPTIFAKGQAYKERDQRIHQDLFEEEKKFVFGRSKLYETPGLSFSTTGILKGFFDIYSEETRLFLEGFRKICSVGPNSTSSPRYMKAV
jgi:rfaE bifunctional protein nucleotidyltransferase chain/domain